MQQRFDLMDTPPEKHHNITLWIILFEGGLAVLALVVGWIIGFWPLETITLTAAELPGHGKAALWGVLATLPMLAIPIVVDRVPLRPFRRLRLAVDELIVPLFRDCTIVQLAMIALCAGAGEELLFRGLLQDVIADKVSGAHGMWLGLVVASLVFGVIHWITPTYAILAGLVGLYLGWLFLWSDTLITPIVAHGVYDFLVLIYLVNKKRRPEPFQARTAGR